MSLLTGYRIFVGGELIENVVALTLTHNKSNSEENKATIYYEVNGYKRIMTVGLEEFKIESA